MSQVRLALMRARLTEYGQSGYGQPTMCADTRNCTVTTSSEAETRSFGRRIGSVCAAGDLICLNGDLGAGKTTLVQGIAQGLGLPARQVTSPTFTLVAEHPDGRIPLYHLDVYRLTSPDHLYDLGVDDFLRRADGITVIEWAERVAPLLPSDCIVIDIKIGDEENKRQFVISAHGDCSAILAAKLC